jgi:peroxiredoxin
MNRTLLFSLLLNKKTNTMVHTFSNMLDLGTKAPDFELTDVVSGKKFQLNKIKSDIATVIMFLSNHCPYVKHINEKLADVSGIYSDKGISFVGISANDADAFPDDAPEKLKEQAEIFGFTFPYLYDETQTVAKAYKAACTPDFFVFDKDLELVYRGQFDSSRHKNDIPVSGKDLCEALDALIEGKTINPEQLPSSGCNIKWKAGINPF